jgi:hypothetical protein
MSRSGRLSRPYDLDEKEINVAEKLHRSVSCPYCHTNIDGKTWKRHMIRVHHLSKDALEMRAFFATIHIPFGLGDRRKMIHV